MKYSTKINLNNNGGKGKRPTPKKSVFTNASRNPVSRFNIAALNSPKRAGMAAKKSRISAATKKKIRKVVMLFAGIFLLALILGGLWFFAYLQQLNDQLPSIDDPFRQKELASVIYDRDGTELYKMFNEFNRDPVDIKEIPPMVQWSFLAAEDIDFFNHHGFDPVAIVRCGIEGVLKGGSACGASTITQQTMKITALGNEPALERKIKELLLSIKVEQAYTKEQILQIYLTVTPFGSNIYGVTTASQFYFGKDPKDLDLAQATILASIIQNPLYLSPTQPVTSDKQTAQAAVKDRQMYVLGQMETYMNKINDQNRINQDDPNAPDIITQDMIDAAKAEVLAYAPPTATDIKAGHFINFALTQLETGNYKNGSEPFTLSDLQTGGYKIYTTLDYDLQQVAESSVANAVKDNGGYYGYNNAAVMTTIPSTGEILTMAGSKSFSGDSEGCDADGINCTFDPQVNVLTTTQSPGSSTKPMGAYEEFREGKLYPGSFAPDIPINDQIGGGYTVKNWDGGYYGVQSNTYFGQMLRESRNIPAVIGLETIGIPAFLKVMQDFGYTTFDDASQFGPSIILGGSDVIPVEHAQGYGVFATQGYLNKAQSIEKIVDRDGNVVYQFSPTPTKVGDEKALYIVNETLNNNYSFSWDGRDISAKTGTSQDSTDAWVVAWSPDMVTVGWTGNNNNVPMQPYAFGEGAVATWLRPYVASIGTASYFNAKTPWQRPGGVIEGGGCTGDCLGDQVGMKSGLMIAGLTYAPDHTSKKIRVCVDQDNRLARPIDEALGLAEDQVATYWKMPYAPWQAALDKYLVDRGTPNGGPNQPCDIDRSGVGSPGPLVGTTSPADGATVPNSGSLSISGTVFTTTTGGSVTNISFTLGNVSLGNGTISGNNFSANLSLPGGLESGTYTLNIKLKDSAGLTSTKPITLIIGSTNSSHMTMSVGVGGLVYNTTVGNGHTQSIQMTYSGSVGINGVHFFVQKNGDAYQQISESVSQFGNTYSINWGDSVPNDGATYHFYATATSNDTLGSLVSLVSGDYTVH